MTPDELDDLRGAVALLENPAYGVKVAELVGGPIERAITLLPEKANRIIVASTRKAIEAALWLALKTLPRQAAEGAAPVASKRWHLAVGAGSGALGGAFGWLALSIELPISTTIIMRSIADVARSEGADLGDLRVQLECVQVLALGARPAKSDDGAEIGYFLAREAMHKAVSDAALHLAHKGMKQGSSPALLRLITLIAQRYSINVSEKVATQLVPLLGAVGGALINTLFIDHFQNLARGHFVVRRLERKYGAALIHQHYLELRRALGK
jgi:hypothetical protein